MKIQVIHIISGLIAGGAETMLYKLLAASDRTRFAHTVVSLSDRGQLADKIEALGVQVVTMGMKRALGDVWLLQKLRHYLQQHPHAVIQTWMYHSDLLGGALARFSTRVPVAWNICSDIVPFSVDKVTYSLARLGALFSASLPTRIVCCSEVAQQSHLQIGYCAEKMVVIPNGFDLNAFCVNEALSAQMRSSLGIESETPVIGLVTRFDPRKDLPNFAAAAALLQKENAHIRFLVCGNGMTWENSELVALFQAAGITDNVILLGRRDDVPQLFTAMDIATSTSYSEAFPLAIGEAMACGVPGVVTDVGDSAYIVGAVGVVVPPQNPEALAAGWLKLLRLTKSERRELGLKARQRIEEKFNLPVIVARYENLYVELAASRHGAS